MSKSTGHAEIDQQHSILENLMRELEFFCSEKEWNQNASCAECRSQKRLSCTSGLASLYSELRAFLLGHNTYEERLMELLPNTPKCQTHIKKHKHAHDQILRQLNKFSIQLTEESPRVGSTLLFKVVSSWLGHHIAQFDNGLVNYLDSSPPVNEINFDDELVAILDQYVFPNRPTRVSSSPDDMMELKKKRLEVRGRFESLSPAQRKVFWLVVAGKKNREIVSELGVSINTIKTHRAAIFQKMEVKTALELVKKADVLR